MIQNTQIVSLFSFLKCTEMGGGPHYITSAGLGLIMYTRLTSTKVSAYLCLVSTEVKGMYHYAHPTPLYIFKQVFQDKC